jgi:hypothetical protein
VQPLTYVEKLKQFKKIIILNEQTVQRCGHTLLIKLLINNVLVWSVYIIECGDIIELYDVKDLVVRADNISIVVNEFDPADWHGMLSFSHHPGIHEKLSAIINRTLTVAFNCNCKNYLGLIKTAPVSVSTDSIHRIGFQGTDTLHVK